MNSRTPHAGVDRRPHRGPRRAAIAAASGLAGLILLAAAPAEASGMSHGRAVAEKGPPGNMCVMALEATGKLAIGSLDVTGTPNVCLASSPVCPSYPSAYECDVYNDSQSSDSTDIGGGSTISAKNYHLSGGYSVSNNGALYKTGQISSYVPAVPDPYANYQIPSYSGCNLGSYGHTWSPTANMTIGPAAPSDGPFVICGGVSVNAGVTLTLNPGIYVIDGGSLTVNGGGTLTGTGVQVILTSSDPINNPYGTISINGNGGSPANVNISAPTSGPTSGVAFWVDRNAPYAKEVFNGGTTQIINGAIYAPNQEVDYSGGSSAGTNCSQLVALNIKFSSNPYFKHNCQGAGVQDPAGPPKLVE